jgi:uncharacterized membrane protein
MKKRVLQIGSFVMALVVLFVSMGWDVKFHYCTEDHRLSSSFGEAAESCLHCLEHEHDHEAHFMQQHEIQFDAKCCCEDFESKIQFTDNYVFSTEKHLDIHFQPFVFVHFDLQELLPKSQQAWHQFIARKIPHFFSTRDRLVFFSNLRLNPLVF